MFELRCGDALELLASLETASVDALITDPPYATTALAWDQPVDWPAFWREAERVCKPTAPMVVFSAQPFTTDLIASNRKHFRYDLIWQKSRATRFLDANRMPLRAHEHIAVFCQEGYGTYNPQKTEGEPYAVRTGANTEIGHYRGERHGGKSETGERHPLSVQYFSSIVAVHPTEKPVELMAWLVRTYSNAGDLVLDPFSGSGSTGAACLETGRRFIGSELSPDYHRLALDRLQAIACQPSLFGEEVAA